MALDPRIEEKYNAFAKAVYGSDALPAKVIELMAFAVSVAVHCDHCMRFHHRSAVEAGASESELSLGVAVAMAVRAGKCRGTSNAIIDTIQQETARAR